MIQGSVDLELIMNSSIMLLHPILSTASNLSTYSRLSATNSNSLCIHFGVWGCRSVPSACCHFLRYKFQIAVIQSPKHLLLDKHPDIPTWRTCISIFVHPQPWPLDLLGPPLQLSCSAAALRFWHWSTVKSIQTDCFWLFGQLVFELCFLHRLYLCACMLAQRLCPFATVLCKSFYLSRSQQSVLQFLLCSSFQKASRLTASPTLAVKKIPRFLQKTTI